jgi:hypothetical protein
MTGARGDSGRAGHGRAAAWGGGGEKERERASAAVATRGGERWTAIARGDGRLRFSGVQTISKCLYVFAWEWKERPIASEL